MNKRAKIIWKLTDELHSEVNTIYECLMDNSKDSPDAINSVMAKAVLLGGGRKK
mgnify:CR=1 FL=1